MSLLKSINDEIKQKQAELDAMNEMFAGEEGLPTTLAEADELLSELFGFGKKKVSQEDQEEADRKNRERIARNKEAENVVNGDLNKKWGVPKLKADGSLPDMPEGMSKSDYELWIESLRKEARDKKFDMGPKRGDKIMIGGNPYFVTAPHDGKKMIATVRNEEGKESQIPWEKLSKPKQVGNKSVYAVKS